jgi:hypothetical protein
MPKNSTLVVNIGQGLSLMIGLPTIATWRTAERPKDARRGTFGFNTETKNLEFFDGNHWLVTEMTEESS